MSLVDDCHARFHEDLGSGSTFKADRHTDKMLTFLQN
jgi:hypothetical protein